MAEAVKSLRPAKSHAGGHAAEVISKPAPVTQRIPKAISGENSRKKNSPSAWKSIRPRTFSRRIFEQVDKVMASRKVDAIDINSGPWRAWHDALIVASALEARGVETVPHLTTRDQNIIGLQAALLGAWTVAASATFSPSPAILRPSATTRKPAASTKSTPWASSKFCIAESGHRLAEKLSARHEFYHRRRRESRRRDVDNEIERFHAKVEAGAHFAMTQPLFDPNTGTLS